MPHYFKNVFTVVALSLMASVNFCSDAFALSKASRVTTVELGLVRVGMTPTQAEQALGMRFLSRGYYKENHQCYFIEPEDNPWNIAFMVTHGRIARIDIAANSPIRTLSGAGIGDTEYEILDLFPNQIKIRPHSYVQGNYLEFIPLENQDLNYRVIFETYKGIVRRYRAGKIPEVMYIEGCS